MPELWVGAALGIVGWEIGRWVTRILERRRRRHDRP